MPLPETTAELMVLVARETARMSYPSGMTHPPKPVVKGKTKKTVEDYFADVFPLQEVWDDATRVAANFEAWHLKRVKEMARAIKAHVPSHNNREAVAAKLLNTFLHQLMKYERCRPLWSKLYLPLDRRVFDALRRLHAPALECVRPHLSERSYALEYDVHLEIQEALLSLIRELNRRPEAEFKFKSRIELNLLWV